MATVHRGHPHDEPHDDDSLLGDDLIEADDGEYFYLPSGLPAYQRTNMILIRCNSSRRR